MTKIKSASLLIHILLLIVIVVALFSPVISGSFVYDDHALIEQNPLVTQSNVSLPRIFTEPFPNKEASFLYYRPITTSIYRFLYQNSPNQDMVLHIANILFHALITICLYFLINFHINHPASAFLATLMFAVMPGHAEAVLWISSLSELLVAFSLILILILIHRYLVTNHPVYLIWIPFLFLFGILSKETMAVGIPIILMIGVGFKQIKPDYPRVKAYLSQILLPVLIVFLAYLLLRFHALGSLIPGPEKGFVHATFFQRIPLILKVYWQGFISMFYLPFPNVEYYWTDALRMNMNSFLGLGLIAGSLVIWFKARARIVKDGITIFFLGFILYAHFFTSTELFAERFLYIPSIGFCMILGYLFKKIPSRKFKLVSFLLLSYFFIAATQTFSYAMVWKSDHALWEYTYTHFRTSPKTMSNYVKTLFDLGHLKKAYMISARMVMTPESARDGYVHMLSILGRTKLYSDGIKVARNALKAFPEDPEILFLLGKFYLYSNDFQQGKSIIDKLKKRGGKRAGFYLTQLSRLYRKKTKERVRASESK